MIEDRDDTFAGPEQKSSAAILSALKKAETYFRDWQATCDEIDDVYSLLGATRAAIDGGHWSDTRFDLFWASFEILKPAVYARPPRPAVAPLFNDNRPLLNVTSELLERVSISTFARTGIDDVMTEIRDDLLFSARGVPWLRYDSEDGQKVCVEHKDRKDFLHDPARKWSEVGWVAARSWMTRAEMRKRFRKTSGDAYRNAQYRKSRDDDHSEADQARTKKTGVWEVWHRAENKVYWVTEGVEVLLDSDEPHLKLSTFWPTPRPAYGTLQRRTLRPVPDWERYASHFRKISELTGRIYCLLDAVRMKGIVPGGGDIGDAIEQVIKSDDDEIIIPVPAAAFTASAGGQLVAWLPLAEVAQAIQGLIEARGRLIEDFYQLSGISDIMRGATEAEETLGAQQLKSQYGSVRVRCKIDEIQRVAADTVKIAAEIIAENFSKETLLEMSQMEIPTKREIDKRIKEIEEAAEAELKAFAKKAEQAAQQGGEQGDPAQAEQAMQQAQQQILQKYAQMLAEAQAQVPIEDVMKLLRDDRARNFAFEIETDSTILTDEMQEKASRTEFLTQFTAASQGLMSVAAMGEAGATLAGELMKFVLAPYRTGRTLSSAIDEFVKVAPQMAAQAQGQEGEGDELAAANNKLAEAEMVKAQAQMFKAQADSRNREAETQRQMNELILKAQNDRAKMEAEYEKLRQSAASAVTKAEEAAAKIDLIRAQTMKALADAGVAIDNQALDEFKSLADIEFRQNDQAMKAESAAVDQAFRARGEDRADFQQMNGGEQ